MFCWPARRARAPNTPRKTQLIWRAGARAARARTYAQRRFGSLQTQPKWTMFLQQASKQKLKIRIAKKQKHCILQCLWPAGHMRKGGSGAHKHSQNHGMDDVFAASEKTKIEDKDSEKTKTLCFTMFLACRAQNLAFRRVPRTSLFAVFCIPTEDKTTVRAMFSHSRNPKMKPKQWYLRCFCNSEKGIFGECRKTQINIRMAKTQ